MRLRGGGVREGVTEETGGMGHEELGWSWGPGDKALAVDRHHWPFFGVGLVRDCTRKRIKQAGKKRGGLLVRGSFAWK